MTRGKEVDKDKGIYNYYVSRDTISLEGAKSDKRTITFQFRVAADSANSAGEHVNSKPITFTLSEFGADNKATISESTVGIEF